MGRPTQCCTRIYLIKVQSTHTHTHRHTHTHTHTHTHCNPFVRGVENRPSSMRLVCHLQPRGQLSPFLKDARSLCALCPFQCSYRCGPQRGGGGGCGRHPTPRGWGGWGQRPRENVCALRCCLQLRAPSTNSIVFLRTTWLMLGEGGGGGRLGVGQGPKRPPPPRPRGCTAGAHRAEGTQAG